MKAEEFKKHELEKEMEKLKQEKKYKLTAYSKHPSLITAAVEELESRGFKKAYSNSTYSLYSLIEKANIIEIDTENWEYQIGFARDEDITTNNKYLFFFFLPNMWNSFIHQLESYNHKQIEIKTNENSYKVEKIDDEKYKIGCIEFDITDIEAIEHVIRLSNRKNLSFTIDKSDIVVYDAKSEEMTNKIDLEKIQKILKL